MRPDHTKLFPELFLFRNGKGTGYTRGDPVNRFDPSGQDDCDPDEETCICEYESCICPDLLGTGGCFDPGPGPSPPPPPPPPPSCKLVVATMGMPSVQNIANAFEYAPKSNTLGPYTTANNDAYPNLYEWGWFFAIQFQGTLMGDTDPGDWRLSATADFNGKLNISDGRSVTTQPVNGSRPDRPDPPAIYTANGVFDWLDAPDVRYLIPGGEGMVVGGNETINLSATLSDGAGGCSANWAVNIVIPYSRGATGPSRMRPVRPRPPAPPRPGQKRPL